MAVESRPRVTLTTMTNRAEKGARIKKRIMIVDDEAAFTRMMKLVLEKSGLYEVVGENRATQAFATARAYQPDLILLDVVMPEMDGGDVAAQLKADPTLKHIPIIFLTALVSEKEVLGGALTRTGHRFLGKLVKDTDLLACIEQSLAL